MVKYMKLGNVRIRRLVGWLVVLAVVVPLLLWAADDVKIKLTDTAGVSTFAIQDSTTTTRFQIGSDGNVKLGAWQSTTPVAILYGGTGAALTASNGGIVYSGASALAILGGTATAGQILRSGTSAAPSWSTATYPTTVASAGQVLRASAANVFGASTTTYPEVSAIGQILYASGTTALSTLAIGTTGKVLTVVSGLPAWATPTLYNQSVSSVTGYAADTYLVGSSIAIPSGSLKAGTRYHLIFDASKTAAGTAASIIYVRFGTAGTTADVALLTFTFPEQSADIDVGTFEVWVTFRVVGASGVIQGAAQLCSGTQGLGKGFQKLGVTTVVRVTSAAFDSTVANSIIGASVNGGTSAAWTIALVQAELENLN